jgi:hypothetical protein
LWLASKLLGADWDSAPLLAGLLSSFFSSRLTFLGASFTVCFSLPPQRGRDLNSKTINQTAALPIHAPAHFAAGVSKGGERGRDRPKERGGPLPVLASIILCPWPVSFLALLILLWPSLLGAFMGISSRSLFFGFVFRELILF